MSLTLASDGSHAPAWEPEFRRSAFQLECTFIGETECHKLKLF